MLALKLDSLAYFRLSVARSPSRSLPSFIVGTPMTNVAVVRRHVKRDGVPTPSPRVRPGGRWGQQGRRRRVSYAGQVPIQ